jgi:hypothetical protein
MLATGKPSPTLSLWASAARFRFALASTLWFVSVFVFLSLRRGGAQGIWKGELISVWKRWFYLVLFLLALLVAILSWVDVVSPRGSAAIVSVFP